MTVFMKGWRDEPDKVMYEGATLSIREHNGYNDSDFYATVWDDEKGVISIEYATTRAYTYDNWAKVDATDEVREKARRWQHDRVYELELEEQRERNVEESHQPMKGRMVRVVKGRKVPIGTTGEVFWFGEGTWGPRVGFHDADGETFWTAASNVEVIDPDQYLASEGTINERAAERAARSVRNLRW